MGEIERVSGAASLIADLLVAEFCDASAREEFGLIFPEPGPYSRERVLELLPAAFKKAKGKLRVALVGDHEAVARFKRERPAHADLVCADEETIVSWRNQKLKTIVVVCEGQLDKQGSLKEFRVSGEQVLIQRLATQQREDAEVQWLRSFWDAVASPRAPELSIHAVSNLAVAINELPAAQRSFRVPKNLYLLGLFPDDHLADESTPAKIVHRLQFNARQLNLVSNAAPEDWDRMTNFCEQLKLSDKRRLSSVRRRLRELNQAPNVDLAQVDLADVKRLWESRSEITSSRTDVEVPATNGQPHKVAAESVVVDLLMSGHGDELSDLAQGLSQLTSLVEEERRKATDEPLLAPSARSDAPTHATASADAHIIELAKTRSTVNEWGGVMDIDSDSLEALTDVAAITHWHPFLYPQFLGLLNEFVEADLAPTYCLELAESLAEQRKALLDYIGELTASPLTVLAGRAEVFAAAEKYLNAYDLLLRQVQTSYAEMYSHAADEAERLVHWLLSLELYIYRREVGVEVLLSPVHPLNLWRTVAIVRDLQNLEGPLSDGEKAALIGASATDVQLLNVLLLPEVKDAQIRPMLLGYAGSVAHLPLFKEAPRGVLEPDGAKTVGLLSELIGHLRPFARPGLQLLLVNAPRPAKFIESVLDRLDLGNESTEQTFWGVHIRLRYTSEDTRGWTSELQEIDDQLRDRIRAGQEDALVSLSVEPEPRTWEQLIEETTERPAHLTVVFDPFQVRTALVARSGVHDMSPWMPTCDYRYNRLKKQIMVIQVAEEEVFATYLSAAKLVHKELQQSTATHQPKVTEVKPLLDELAANSTWFAVAEPHRVLLPRAGSSDVIDRRIDGARQITTFTQDLSPFIRRLDQQLRTTHFITDPATLEALIGDLVAMEPNGILGLVGGEKSKHVKGALGKLIASRWYRRLDPSGLAVSLDTQTGRRWLTAGALSKEQADLIGLREHNGAIVIDVLEVKAHDEGMPYAVVNGCVTGKAVDQVLATLRALTEVFHSGTVSPLAKPRREVLREHLYTALMRDLDPKHIQRWHDLLEDLFEGKLPVRLSGRIVHVRLSSVAAFDSICAKTESGVPIEINTLSAADVGLALTSTDSVAAEIPSGIEPADAGAMEPVQLTELLFDRVKRDSPGLEGTSLAEPELPAQARGPNEETGEEGEPTFSTPQQLPDTSPQLVGAVSATQVELSDHHDFVEPQPQFLEVPLGTEVISPKAVTWSPGRQSNGFFLILGASGSGKTETLKVIGKGIGDYGVPVLVLDFHGDVQFPGVKSYLLSSGTSSTIGVNPLELDSYNAEETGLYDQRKVIRDVIRNAVPALGHRQGSILRDAIEEAYVRAGIDDADPSTWRNPPPTFKDIDQILSDWADDDSRKSLRSSIEGCLSAVQEIFEHPIFHRKEYISIDEILGSNVRLDLSKLSDGVRYIAAETVLRKVFRVLRLKGPIPVQPLDDHQRFRLFVVIDEAKILSTGAGDPDSPDRILNLLFTEARKFGLGMVLASQMSDHFGSEVKANAATWLVLKPMDMREAKKNAPNVHLEPEALTALKGKGDGYIRDRQSPRARRIQVRPLHDGSMR